MPLYDYTCDECGQTFELLVGSATVAVCPHCGSNRLQQLIGAPIAPGKSAAIMAAGRARAANAGHATNYKRSHGKIVD
jgi:putative FmdB family regulatory protein